MIPDGSDSSGLGETTAGEGGSTITVGLIDEVETRAGAVVSGVAVAGVVGDAVGEGITVTTKEAG